MKQRVKRSCAPVNRLGPYIAFLSMSICILQTELTDKTIRQSNRARVAARA